MSQVCRATVVRQSYDVHASVANMSPRDFGEFTMPKIRDTRTIVVRMPLDRRATVLTTIWRENKLSDIRTNFVRHSHEYLATVIRMKMKQKLHSWERPETTSRMSRDDSRATIARQSRDIFSKLDLNSRICLIKSIQGDCNV